MVKQRGPDALPPSPTSPHPQPPPLPSHLPPRPLKPPCPAVCLTCVKSVNPAGCSLPPFPAAAASRCSMLSWWSSPGARLRRAARGRHSGSPCVLRPTCEQGGGVRGGGRGGGKQERRSHGEVSTGGGSTFLRGALNECPLLACLLACSEIKQHHPVPSLDHHHPPPNPFPPTPQPTCSRVAARSPWLQRW